MSDGLRRVAFVAVNPRVPPGTLDWTHLADKLLLLAGVFPASVWFTDARCDWCGWWTKQSPWRRRLLRASLGLYALWWLLAPSAVVRLGNGHPTPAWLDALWCAALVPLGAITLAEAVRWLRMRLA